MKSITATIRKLFVYPGKLLATFGPAQSLVFIWKYALGDSPIRIQTAVFPTPVWLRPRSTDVRVVYELFTTKELEMPWPLKQSPRSIIDGGANVGYATMAFKNRWPAAYVLGVEPDHENFAILEKNCQGLSKVALVMCGIWGSQCSLGARLDSTKSAWGLQFEPVPDGTTGSIRARTVSSLIDLLPEKHCDLLKLDIEGAESDVFSQADLDWIKRVSVILIETHGREARKIVVAVASTWGFEISPVGEKIMLWRK
jgi:FkbM family methyltransferase